MSNKFITPQEFRDNLALIAHKHGIFDALVAEGLLVLDDHRPKKGKKTR